MGVADNLLHARELPLFSKTLLNCLCENLKPSHKHPYRNWEAALENKNKPEGLLRLVHQTSVSNVS